MPLSPSQKKAALEKKFNEIYKTTNKKNAEIPLLRFLFNENFEVDDSGNLLLKPESELRYDGDVKKTERAYKLSNQEKKAKYAINPLTQTYMGEVRKLSDRLKDRDSSGVINDYKKLEGRYNSMGSYLTDPGAKKYADTMSDRLLSPLKHETERQFKEKLMPQLENQMISSGTYGGLIHGKLANQGLRDLQDDFMNKANEIQGRSMQQSAQIYHADQDAAMNRLSMLNQLATQRKAQEEGEERKLSEMANKVQNDEQNYLDNFWHQQRYNQREPVNRLKDYFNSHFSDNLSKEQVKFPDPQQQYQEDFRTTQMAKGGVVDLKATAKKIQAKGRHGDTMLAHINPQEALLLKLAGGSGTINPETGLPEYFFPLLLPLLAGAGGMAGASALGLGTLGTLALAGGLSGLGGMIGPKDRKLGFLKAGLLGAAMPTALGGLGAGLTGMGATTAGKALTSMAGSGSLLPMLSGVAGGSAATGSSGAANALGLSALKPAAGAAAGGLSALDKAGMIGSLMSGASNAYSAYSQNKMANQQIEMQKQQVEEQKKAIRKQLEREDLLMAERSRLEAEQAKLEKESRRLDAEDRKRMLNFKIGRAHDPDFGQFFKGGYVDGGNSGIADDIKMGVPKDSYVLDATTISLLGDGNSKAGAKQISDYIERMEGKIGDKVYTHGHFNKSQLKNNLPKKPPKIVDIMVSGGEYILKPSHVVLFSKSGDLKSAVMNLDRLRRNLKKHKKLSTDIPSRTKQIESYI